MSSVHTKNVAILLFADVELLDFAGPFEVFCVANRRIPQPQFNVYTVAERSELVKTHNGLAVQPHYSWTNCPQPNILICPGGLGTRTEMNNPNLIEWIKQASENAELVLSVCTGALLLGKAGLLDGLKATTHHGALDLLKQTAPKATICAGQRFLDNGKVVVSAGIAAGIDMSLHVVERLLGRELAEETATHMEYPWPSRPVLAAERRSVFLAAPSAR